MNITYFGVSGPGTSPNPTTAQWSIGGSVPAATAWESIAKAHDATTGFDEKFLYRQNSSGVHNFDINPITGIDVGSTIIAVRLVPMGQRTSAGACSLAARVLVDGVFNSGGSDALSTTWTDFPTAGAKWTTNPETGFAWTVDQLAQMASQYNLTGVAINATGLAAGEEARCARLYGYVEWNPPPPPGTGEGPRAFHHLMQQFRG